MRGSHRGNYREIRPHALRLTKHDALPGFAPRPASLSQ